MPKKDEMTENVINRMTETGEAREEALYDLAPCRAGDYVRTPEGYVYKIETVRLMFENDKPDSFYFQCYGCPVYENEDLGPVEALTGFFKVIDRVERPYH